MAVITILELNDRSPHFLQVPEDATMNGLFFQRPVEALGDAIRFRLGDEGEAWGDTPELNLVEEVVGRVLRAVIHTQPRPDVAVAFTGEGRGRQIGPDGLQQVGVGHLGFGPRRCATSGTWPVSMPA
ncbi:hypothetical protein AWB67_07041 [Caballeronia terrestris]|uniref:Uncharacterized protein n=1 Tax=Caballeronia terrestris TaxID=1226301 RepID=A0A158KXF4_9BURK|nr:hypothetical protein AWB67_07041 [Caballeronia terrestris]